MKLNRLHFHPINGKALDIITAILHTEEVASVGKAFDVIRLVAEELVMNIVPIEQRGIGGLGFFIVTKKMDSVKYEYIDGENVLTVMKELK